MTNLARRLNRKIVLGAIGLGLLTLAPALAKNEANRASTFGSPDGLPDSAPHGSPSTNVIYGQDDRKDIYQIQDPQLLSLAASTVGLVNYDHLTKKNGGLSLQTEPYGASRNLCTSERFFDQETSPFCSGFLVAPDVVATAGHCVPTQSLCMRTKFVFGFSMPVPGQIIKDFSNDDVYGCQTLLISKRELKGADFSLVKLDRPVLNRRPLTMRSSGQIQMNDTLMVIGHPTGLPTKISEHGKVRLINSDFFVTTLDTYGGNSGSAVFNSQTYEVEGILVRGEKDFVNAPNNLCRISNVCDESGCRGEDVTRVEAFRQLIFRK